MEERRAVARWQINQRAELKVEDGARPIPCMVEDLCCGGLRLSLTKELFPEVFADFQLALNEDFAFNAGARVAWSEKIHERNIYGLSFNDIAEPEKDRIDQYIKDNFPAQVNKHVWDGIDV